MIELQNRLEQARAIAEQLLQSKMYSFQGLKPSMLESVPGVYAIYDRDTGATLYVGRTKNIRRRLYTNHLMGPCRQSVVKIQKCPFCPCAKNEKCPKLGHFLARSTEKDIKVVTNQQIGIG